MNRRGKTLLVLALVAVVLMAFRVSWNALRDVATAVGADTTAALLYPVVVDGLMALALVATLVLSGPARSYALRVLAAYTTASLVLNYVHGLVPALHQDGALVGRLAVWDPANWGLVLLATSLPVGSIYFGSDLVAKVLHHHPAPERAQACGQDAEHPTHPPHTVATETVERSPVQDPDPVPLPAGPEYSQLTAREDDVRPESPHTPHALSARPARSGDENARQADYEDAELERSRQEARRTYAESVQAARPLSARALGEAYGMSESWGRKQILAARNGEHAPQAMAGTPV
ncbi:DUF2637 domain-containing protein [Streptomyces sp. H27-H1]|uniref:DUF2637 domain-containing protein n=1 Tax=Streptomyces sp. H27-H1 TaxID=2996461 RepID=UPI002271523A|nr:DUF2637 domain-containing protein [Streptomyces sp. H27-H1]MCY0924809.1 DUF2637 domain-containing protein [Streptomyces sp. H27-H1]